MVQGFRRYTYAIAIKNYSVYEIKKKFQHKPAIITGRRPLPRHRTWLRGWSSPPARWWGSASAARGRRRRARWRWAATRGWRALAAVRWPAPTPAAAAGWSPSRGATPRAARSRSAARPARCLESNTNVNKYNTNRRSF